MKKEIVASLKKLALLLIRKFANFLKPLLYRFLHMAKAAGITLAVLAAADYVLYKSMTYEVLISASPLGKILFSHEDRETTELLNYISGKENLSPQLKKLINEPKPEFNEKLYYALWELEQSCGNPRIRLRTSGYKDFYLPLTNTIYINPSHFLLDARDSLISELSHARQRKEYKINIFRAIKDSARAAASFLISVSKEIWDKSYNIPGTIEYEAHKIIEPELLKKIEEIEKEAKNNKNDEKIIIVVPSMLKP